MAECTSSIIDLEVDEQLIAAAKCITSAIVSNKNLTDEAIRAMDDLVTLLISSPWMRRSPRELENLLDAVEEKVMSWDAGNDGYYECLNTADEARKLNERLKSLSLNKEDDDYDKKMELQRRAHDVLQKAMANLEEEFTHLLVMNRTAVDPKHTVSCYTEDNIDYLEDSVEGSVYNDCISSISEEIVDVVHIDVIPKLRSIATLMFNSKFEQECTRAYISARKNAFNECLILLNLKALSIEEVRRMDSTSFNYEIKKWVHAVQIFTRVFLSSELCLCDKIFGELGPVTLFCFVEASNTSMLQLLDFGQSISNGSPLPLRLFRILDMYEVISGLQPHIEALYKGEAGSSIIMKCHELRSRIGNYVSTIFTQFENEIVPNYNSENPVLGGNISPWAKYVMNYIKTLTDYSETLNFLFKDQDKERDHHIASLSPNEENSKRSPMARRFLAVVAVLERNLDAKSKLYKNTSLQHLFLMNNIHYMAQKVRDSELRPVFGYKWIKDQYWKCQQHSMDYERASWGSILSLLDDKGIPNPISGSASKILLKERLRSFYLTFKEIYKTQTGWFIPDVELREDLRISISLKVILAHRSFVGRYSLLLSDKHIKYTDNDLENYLLDLFEGSQKSL